MHDLIAGLHDLGIELERPLRGDQIDQLVDRLDVGCLQHVLPDHAHAVLAGRAGLGGILLTGAADVSAWEGLVTDLGNQGVEVRPASPGEVLDLGGQAQLEVVAVSSRGGVLLLRYGRARFLFAPGADPRMIGRLTAERAVGNVTALWLGDSGNATVNPSSWLALTQPQAALISVEAGNLRGLPSPEVLHALGGTSILRTDEHGWISLATDGTNLWVETEHSELDGG